MFKHFFLSVVILGAVIGTIGLYGTFEITPIERIGLQIVGLAFMACGSLAAFIHTLEQRL